jgi:hypothetical protein
VYDFSLEAVPAAFSRAASCASSGTAALALSMMLALSAKQPERSPQGKVRLFGQFALEAKTYASWTWALHDAEIWTSGSHEAVQSACCCPPR